MSYYNELCSFCISRKPCKKPKAERDRNCSQYMFKIDKENDR